MSIINLDNIEIEVNKHINDYLYYTVYKQLNINMPFDIFKIFDENIFELFTKDNINEFIINYKEIKPIITYAYWKDMTYLYKLDINYKNKYIFNLLSSDNKKLFIESLELINISDNKNFNKIPFDIINNYLDNKELLYNYMKNMLNMILPLLNKNYQIPKIEDIDKFIVNNKFSIILNRIYQDKIDNLLNLEIVIYCDINYNKSKISLKKYLYFICLYYYILFTDNEFDLKQFHINEEIGKASNINEYSYDNYKVLSNILTEQFQEFLKQTDPESILRQDNDAMQNTISNLNTSFIIMPNLPYCFNEDNLERFEFENIDINNLDINKLIDNNLDFKINNLWFNRFSKMPCINNDNKLETVLGGANGESADILHNSNCNYFPHFIKSVIKKDLQNTIEILDLDTQIINKYLKWFYRPTILGPVKYKFEEMRECNINNYNFLYYYTDLTENNNPFHYTLYYNKLWIQLICYRTRPNAFLNDILNELEYNKYLNMPIQLTYLFPFIFSINILKTKILNPDIGYYKLDLDIEQYYTIENIAEYDYLGYIFIPFNIDTRNIRKKGEEHLQYFLFKHNTTNDIVISDHRNKVYSFFQKETPNLSLMELNIIGYVNYWNKRYNEWTLYPYLVIYTSKYKYYNNLYTIDETIQPYKTNIYISTLKYEELLSHKSNLNDRLYNNEINNEINNDNIEIQLNIPSDEDLIDIKKNIHLYIIPIIPILCHKNVKFVCPIQKEYIIKDYQSLIAYQAPSNIYIPPHKRIGGYESKYFKKYLKYKLKYNKLLNDNS